MKKYGIRVATSGSVVTDDTAEFAVTLLLAISRQLIVLLDAYKR